MLARELSAVWENPRGWAVGVTRGLRLCHCTAAFWKTPGRVSAQEQEACALEVLNIIADKELPSEDGNAMREKGFAASHG